MKECCGVPVIHHQVGKNNIFRSCFNIFVDLAGKELAHQSMQQ